MPPKGSKIAPPAPPPPDTLSPAAQQQQSYMSTIADYELPKTTLTKLAKGSIPDNVKIQQDVVLALLRSSTLFINYLTAAAHDQALARSGKSITASDVLKAVAEMDFGPADNLIPLLEVELAAYRSNQQAAKASKSKPPGPGRGRRRKSNAGGEDVDMEGGEGDGDEDDEDEGEGGVGDQSAVLDDSDGDDR